MKATVVKGILSDLKKLTGELMLMMVMVMMMTNDIYYYQVSTMCTL